MPIDFSGPFDRFLFFISTNPDSCSSQIPVTTHCPHHQSVIFRVFLALFTGFRLARHPRYQPG
jgi:hypothetical protein